MLGDSWDFFNARAFMYYFVDIGFEDDIEVLDILLLNRYTKYDISTKCKKFFRD